MFKTILASLILFVAASPLFAQNVSRAQMEADIVAFRAKLQAKEEAAGFGDVDLRAQLRAQEEAFLAPDMSDLTGVVARKPEDGGVIRLMPREKYARILRIYGGGGYYSFTRLTHEYGYGSDLQLDGGNLSVGFAGADFGFIADLGEVPLESLSLGSAGVPELAKFQPPGDEPHARIEQARFHRDFRDGALSYVNEVKVAIGHTFALRSISYRRSDVLVTFRILRQDVDGSVILSWKLLKRYSTPPLELAPPPSAEPATVKASN
jgi:hypothetical protein